MANEATTTGTTPSTGGLNYEDYQKKIQQAAATTRDVTVPTGTISQAKKTASRWAADPWGKGAGEMSKALISQFEAGIPQMKERAERAASALEMVGSSTLQGIKSLESAQQGIRAAVSNAADTWGAAAEKADEYVKASRGRVSEVLTKLDDLHRQIGEERNFAKAHDMQASVQAVMGSMKNEERNIIENYGADSKEYAQFRASKQSALATVQSNIHANYAQLREQSDQTYLSAVSDAYVKSNMYVGFQEQQHVEMLKYQAEQENLYALQAAQMDVNIEQMKMSGMENLANWIIETPTFSMDATPLITMMNDLNQIATANWLSYKGIKAGGGGGFDWGQLAGTAIGAGVGAATGGIGTAVGSAVGSRLTKGKK